MTPEEEDVIAQPAARPLPAPPEGAPPDFRAVFQNESGYVWHTLRRLGVRDADLEDLTHDVLLTVYRKLGDYDPSRPLRPWLFGIALRVASRYRQLARHRREVYDSDAEPVDQAPAADVRMEAREQSQLVVEALDLLSIERKAVFVLHDIDECGMPEIARTLEVPLNTAYSRLRLARADFKKAIERLRLRKGMEP